MDAATPPQLLSKIGMFSLLDNQELQALFDQFSRQTFPAGSKIFNYGEVGEEMYVVESGEVELFVRDTTGDKISLTTLREAEVFGELSMLDLGPRSATAETLSDTTLLILTREHLLAFLVHYPKAALELLAVFAKRIRETDQLLMGRVTRNLNHVAQHQLPFFQRLAGWIADFSGSISFLALNVLMFFAWIVINVDLIPGVAAFDPYPFGFLTMSVSLEAIFLSIFVLLAQNIQSAKERIKSDIEYEVNLKAELEIGELHKKVDLLHGEMVRQFRGIDRQFDLQR